MSRLPVFEAAARHESFTTAAVELGLTQTAVTKQIAALEADLGVQLFERRNRAVFLTDAGRAYGRVVGAALSEISAETTRLRGGQSAGGLVLHCQLCEAFYWLMPRLLRFHERQPGIDVRVVSANAPLTETPEPFDVAIQTTGRSSGSARLAFTASDEIFPVAAPGLVPRDTLPLSPGDLPTQPLLSHRVLSQDWMDWPDWFAALGLRMPRPVKVTQFDSFPLVLQAAVAGQGIALGWRNTVSGLIADGKLEKVCTETIFCPSEISVFRGTRSGNHAETDALLTWLRDELTVPRLQ
jgi:DNA-binding transcriptional LysR family regulator